MKTLKGVHKVTVSFEAKRATVTFNENQTPLFTLLETVLKETPFKLTLFLPLRWKKGIEKNEVIRSLKTVKGVKAVKVTGKGVLVTLAPKAKVRYRQLLDALKRGGPPKSRSKL